MTKLTPGIVVNNRYTLKERVAVGGMGEMWAATDTVLGRKVAIKAIREESAGNEDFLKRLRIEAMNNAVLTHPNIVALHDYYEQNHIGYIIMEFIEGQTLSKMLHETPIIPLEKLLPILAQIASALGFSHSKGVVHRDIKPSNIIITQDGRVKVVDFGVSKTANQTNMTATGMVVGTAQYLSPEQAIGEQATGQSDIYALGVIAYEASQGRRPFGGKNAVDIAIAQVNNPVPPMSDSTNEEFQRIVMNLLEKSTQNRAIDATKVAEEFNALYAKITDKTQESESTKHISKAPIKFPSPKPAQKLSPKPIQKPITGSHQNHPPKKTGASHKRTPQNSTQSSHLRNQSHSQEPSRKMRQKNPTSPPSPTRPTRPTRQKRQNPSRKKNKIMDANMWFLIIVIIIIIILIIFIVSTIVADS